MKKKPCCINTSKQTCEKHDDLLLISNAKNLRSILSKYFDRFMTN